MKFSRFLKDKLFAIIIFVAASIIAILLCLAFKVPFSLIFALVFLATCSCVVILLHEFFRKRRFYTDLHRNIAQLDQAYLVLETLTRPEFYEGKLLFDALYEINKSMKENVSVARARSQDFQEYIEMWIHEVKAPLATLTLINNRNTGPDASKISTELTRLESYLDQVLYYTRSENAEKDYIIQKTDLAKIIKNVGLKNMNALLENHIDFEVANVDFAVTTDAKWLEFILNQIISNSIKYHRRGHPRYIKISARKKHNQIILAIIDNGIGISPADQKQVFNKSFTGVNGRLVAHSTGMGLYLAKSMCTKLGHQISLTSTENKFTKVTITFSNHDYFEVVDEY